MLKIDRLGNKLLRLAAPSTDGDAALRSGDIKQLIAQNAELFFKTECGEDLFVIGHDVALRDGPEETVDILAIDNTGKKVLVAVSGGDQKADFIEALSSASTLSQARWSEYLIQLLDGARQAELRSFLAQHSLAPADIASGQRLILISEIVDVRSLRIAYWLKSFGIEISFYQVAITCDAETSSNYLSALKVLLDRKMYERMPLQPKAAKTPEREPNLDESITACRNVVVQTFFRKLLQKHQTELERCHWVTVPSDGGMRFRIAPRSDYAQVVQTGRYPGDEEHWEQLYSPHLNVAEDRLEFRLYTRSDIEYFENFLVQAVNVVWWLAKPSQEGSFMQRTGNGHAETRIA